MCLFYIILNMSWKLEGRLLVLVVFARVLYAPTFSFGDATIKTYKFKTPALKPLWGGVACMI
jgi:hypothetical protein